MTNLAFKNDYRDIEDAGSGRFSEENSRSVPVNFTRQAPPPEPVFIDLGLKSGKRLKYSPDKSLPKEFFNALLKLESFRSLTSGWDSYGGKPHNLDCRETAVDLLIFSQRRCDLPDLTPLSDGGVGLRWSTGNREFEIDVHPDGLCSILIADDSSGLEDATDAPVVLEEAEQWLNRYWQLG